VALAHAGRRLQREDARRRLIRLGLRERRFERVEQARLRGTRRGAGGKVVAQRAAQAACRRRARSGPRSNTLIE
jgi:hypothetical protein